MTSRLVTTIAGLLLFITIGTTGCSDAVTPAGDAGTPAADAAPDLLRPTCRRDSDCTDVAAPFCDAASRTCASCNVRDHQCAQGFICATIYGYLQCTESCATPGDCTRGQTGCCGHACVALLTDRSNCGTCDHKCDPWLVCLSGTCSCPQYAPDLCPKSCVDLKTDLMNCGACNAACPIVPRRYSTCVDGKCGFGDCWYGNADCDGNSDNGCETPITNDSANCGGCGKPCPQGQTCHYMTCR